MLLPVIITIVKNIKKYSDFLKALSNENRIIILKEILQRGKISTLEVTKLLFIETATASHHLGILKEAGIIDYILEGRNHYYKLREQVLENNFNAFLKDLLIK